jgi:hypothetical protein
MHLKSEDFEAFLKMKRVTKAGVSVSLLSDEDCANVDLDF